MLHYPRLERIFQHDFIFQFKSIGLPPFSKGSRRQALLTFRLDPVKGGSPELDPAFRANAEIGEAFSLATLRDAQIVREQVAMTLGGLFEDVDLMVLPTLPIAAFAIGHDVPPTGHWPHLLAWTPFTYPFNMAGLLAASVPAGRTGDGRPIGVQLVATRGEDARVLRAAAQLMRN